MFRRDAFGDLPAAEPPPGEQSNLIDPWSLNGFDLVSGVICLVLSVTFFLIRAITKRFLIKSVYWEDYICGLATILFVADVSVVIWAGAIGGGRHQWNTTIDKAFELFWIANTVEILYCATMMFAKTSILLQIRRVFSGLQNRAVRLITTALIWCNILFYIAAGLSFAFACQPREAIWDPLVPGRCIDTFGLFLVSSALNLVSDVMILIIPIFYTWRLALPLRKKLGVSVVFATGAFACVAAIMRLLSTIGLNTASDLTFELMVIGLWSEAEIATVLICGCMPCLPRFLKSFASCELDESYGPGSKKLATDRDTLRGNSVVPDLEKASAIRLPPDPHPISPLHPAFRNAVEKPRRLLLRSFHSKDLDRYEGPLLSSRNSRAPPYEMEDTSPSLPPPPPPPKQAHSPQRNASLSSRATSPQSQMAMQALAGRFWQDAVDDRNAAAGEETRQEQAEPDQPRPVLAHVRNLSRETETRRYTLEGGALRPAGSR